MCGARAARELDGLGDPLLGEWHEWSGSAYHLRRRLSAAEQASVGPVRDIRGTADAVARYQAMPERYRRHMPAQIVAAETGGQPL